MFSYIFDTITFTFRKAQDLTRLVTHSYRDGAGGIGQSLKAQVRTLDGTWVDASADTEITVTATEVALNTPGPVTAVRVVLTARPSGYVTLGEIEVFAKST